MHDDQWEEPPLTCRCLGCAILYVASRVTRRDRHTENTWRSDAMEDIYLFFWHREHMWHRETKRKREREGGGGVSCAHLTRYSWTYQCFLHSIISTNIHNITAFIRSYIIATFTHHYSFLQCHSLEPGKTDDTITGQVTMYVYTILCLLLQALGQKMQYCTLLIDDSSGCYNYLAEKTDFTPIFYISLLSVQGSPYTFIMIKVSVFGLLEP